MPKRARIQQTSFSIHIRIGPSSRTTHCIGFATASAIRSGALKAAVLGNTSAKTTTSTVITAVSVLFQPRHAGTRRRSQRRFTPREKGGKQQADQDDDK